MFSLRNRSLNLIETNGAVEPIRSKRAVIYQEGQPVVKLREELELPWYIVSAPWN